MTASTPHRLMTSKEAAAYLGLSLSSVNHLRIAGGGPQFIKLSAAKTGAVRYRLSDLDVWLSGKTFTSTAQAKQDAA